MKRPLNKLTRELRQQKCPPQVLDRVFAEVEAQDRRPAAWWWLAPALTLGAVALAFTFWPDASTPQAPAIAVQPDESPNSQRAAAEAEASLVLVGHLLRENGLRSGQEVLDRTLPSLQASLNTLQGILETESETDTATTEQTLNNET